MDNWYKKATIREEPSQFEDDGHVITNMGPAMFNKSFLEKLKRKLENRYPKTNWTVEMIYDFYNTHFNENPPRKRLKRNTDFVDDDL